MSYEDVELEVRGNRVRMVDILLTSMDFKRAIRDSK
jgi:hypothetical protein